MGGLFQKKSKQETKGVLLLRTYRFSRDIKERTCGNSRSKLKKKWNVQGVFTKNLWNFYGCWFLTSWNFHQRLSHNSAEFAGVKAYMFSKGKVTNLKFPRVFIRKVYISSPPPTRLEIFWNSPILMPYMSPTWLPRSGLSSLI